MQKVFLQRIYAPKQPQDGLRVLIDKVLPHGRSLLDLNVQLWCPEAGPSNQLQRLYSQEQLSETDFIMSYRQELHTQPEKMASILDVITNENLTLITSHKSLELTWLRLLRDQLETRLKLLSKSC